MANMIFRISLIGFLLSVLSLPAFAMDLTGLWYGERKLGGGMFVQWLSNRRPDGFFDIEFRYFRDCKSERVERQIGRWTSGGNILATHVHMVDGARADIRHRYIIDRLEGEVLHYRHVQTGTPFSARRLPAGSDWPGCVVEDAVS
ncbi:MAG: hypothetical protein ACK4FJ_09855 [Ferrovibrio sp.]|uniref:hypothetical protein n=1 Tax=Ferrovibrio sp. TaxID=1917215 RepID=UPI0039187AA2